MARQALRAREETLELVPLGNGVYSVKRSHYVRDRWCVETRTVDYTNGKCDCAPCKCNRMPCYAVHLVAGKLKDCDTPEKSLAFRHKWVAPYFHSENYINAYCGHTIFPPGLDQDLVIPGITDAKDKVLPPPQPKKKRGRDKIKRATGQPRRSRAKFPADAYVRNMRSARNATGPANPSVIVPTGIFGKKRCGPQFIPLALKFPT